MIKEAKKKAKDKDPSGPAEISMLDQIVELKKKNKKLVSENKEYEGLKNKDFDYYKGEMTEA
jgi:hypothetical protein